eukprot:763396-Hanusia_phi.AAC.6
MKTFCWLLPRVQDQHLSRSSAWSHAGLDQENLRFCFEAWKLQVPVHTRSLLLQCEDGEGKVIRRAESCNARITTSEAIDHLIEGIEQICRSQESRRASVQGELGEEGFLLRGRLQYPSDCETNDSQSVGGGLNPASSPAVHLSFRKVSSSAR